MELTITGKHLDLAPTVRGYIERKLGKLARHLPNILETKVEITEEKTKSREHRFVAQVTMDVNGAILRGEVRGEDLLTAIDRVEKVMARQIERYKGKTYRKGRNSLTRGEPSTEMASPEGKVTKTKRFSLKTMSRERAVESMELLGHDFFLFLNEDSEVNLLYRRRDGNYGLIVANDQ
jgi:putative sigma-54 modulation protein